MKRPWALLLALPLVLGAGTSDLDRLTLGKPLFGPARAPEDLAGKVVVWRTWSG